MDPDVETSNYSEFNLSAPLRSFASTVRGVLLNPTKFFGEVSADPRASLRDPLLFSFICSSISAPLAFLAVPLDPFIQDAPGFRETFSWFPELEIATTGISVAIRTGLISVFVGLLILALIVLGFALLTYIGAALYQLLVRIFVGRENAGFAATFKVFTYVSAVSLLSWVPVLGYLMSLYAFYLTAMGIRELHSTTTTRAVLVAAVPFAFSLLSLVTLFSD